MSPAFDFSRILVLLIPIIIIHIGLQIFALVDLSRQPSVRWNSKWLWVAIIIIAEILGPIIYFLFAKQQE